MEHYLQPNFVQNCLTDMCSIHLTVIGICLTVITLLYSFIFSKRSELSSFSDELKSKLADPLIAQKHGQIIRYIQGLSSIIPKCFFTFLMSCVIWIVCWIDKMFVFPDIVTKTLLIVSLVGSFFELTICIYWGRLIYFQYKKDIDV